MNRVVAIVVMAAAAACGASPPAAPAATAALVERSRVSMGSEVQLSAWTVDEPTALAAFESAFDEFDRLDSLMSVWKPGSEIQRLNEAAGDHPVPVGAEVSAVLEIAKQVGAWTGGKFDVTFGALSDLWKFDHDQDNRIPAPGAVAARLPLVDYAALVLDQPTGTAFLPRRGMRAHLGGIGKGYGVHRAMTLLRSRGLTDFMIQSGGDMYVAGRRGDRPWRIGLRDPRGPADSSFAALDVTEAAISTSGDYERFFIAEGRRYHHILDPDTGQPGRLNRAVTIVATDSTLADALSTGVFLMAPEAGMELIERLPDLEGVIVTAANEVLVSSGLRGRLARMAPPTVPLPDAQ